MQGTHGQNPYKFLRFCSDLLDRPGRAVQDGLSWIVARIGRLSKDPLYEPEILLAKTRRASVRAEFGAPLAATSPEGNPELERVLQKGRGFNEDFYRKPIGWAVLLVVLIFFFVAWAFIELA
jgi:hypothetical protein